MPSVSNPLQQAVFRGCVECIRMLVESPPFYNVDASCGPEPGFRPIHIAAREGHIQTLRFLKSSGACIQKSDASGKTALHHAAITGQLRAVRWLLRHGAKISLDNSGLSPLAIAVKYEHMEIVNVLTKHATSGTTPASSSSGTHSGSNGALKEPNLSLPVSVNLDQFSNTNANHSSTVREKSRERSKERSRERSNIGTTITVNSNGGNIIKTTVNPSSQHKSKLEDSKLFSQPPPPPPPPVSGTDCPSSSGNSSLSASTNTPSLSPSASSTSNSSTTSCGCPVSSSDSSSEELKSATETTHSFTLTDFRTKSPDGSKKDSNSTSFYLHPPKANGNSNGSSPAIQFSCQQTPSPTTNGKVNGSVPGSPTNAQGPTTNGVGNKKFQHSRQPSTCVNTPNSPFFLHPPENLVNETRAVASKMAPAPVNPSHGHHHIQDLINETHSQSKVKNGLGMTSASDFSSNSSSSVSSGSSPPPTPPSQKTGFGIGCTVSALQGKFQQISGSGNNKEESAGLQNNSHNFEVHVQNSINAGNGNNAQKAGVPPPPPPPPMPGFAMDMNNNLIGNNENGPHEPDKKSTNGDGTQVENDYEDIEELTNGENVFEHMAKKLIRTSSCPPPPPPLCDLNLNGNSNYSEEKNNQITPTKPPTGSKAGVPFIPPHFPTPPSQDALIKPSEYLRSIQNKGKTNGTANGGTNVTPPSCPATQNGRPLSKVEEAIKALGVSDNHLAVMSPVPEETNAEDDFEEINPERINGIALATTPVNNSANNICNNTNGTVNLSNGGGSCAGEKPTGKENEHREIIREPIYASPSALGIGKGCGAVIKAEELMKVHLKKTPMSRTRSAPPLGRVIPDNQPLSPTKNGKSNGELLLMNEPLRRSNNALNGSTSNLSTCGEPTTKAAVIAELAESSQVGGVREWKEELRRRQLEEEKAVQKELNQYYQPVNFYAEVPSTDVTGAPIPAWKRQMMAKKAAERARKEAEEQRKLEIEQKRMAAIPLWRRQLLQRRESDGKYAQ